MVPIEVTDVQQGLVASGTEFRSGGEQNWSEVNIRTCDALHLLRGDVGELRTSLNPDTTKALKSMVMEFIALMRTSNEKSRCLITARDAR